MSNNKKPPLGLTPRKIAERTFRIDRINNIFRAMIRYSQAEMVIPTEWIEELQNKVYVELNGEIEK